MTVFFYICEYLGVTPEEFFAAERHDPTGLQALTEAAKGLNSEQLSHLTAIARRLHK